MAAPDIDDVKAYLGPDHSFSDDEITSSLASEILAQAHVCKVPTEAELVTDSYPADLSTALCRRVVRALQMKSKPLGYESNVEGGISFISANDSEIKRLEHPYRKMAVR